VGVVLAVLLSAGLSGCDDSGVGSTSGGTAAGSAATSDDRSRTGIGTLATDTPAIGTPATGTGTGTPATGTPATGTGTGTAATGTGTGTAAAGTPATGAGTGTAATGTPATGTGQGVNTGPTIAGTPATTVVAGSTYSFAPTAADASNSAWTFVIANRPAWATFNAASGTLSGTPTAANVGVYAQIVIGVTDGAKITSLAPFSIAVTAPAVSASDLAISGTPVASVSVGSAYSFTPTAADSAGSKLIFSIANKPVWATFNSSTGALSGTPVAANVGVTPQIQISVSDGTHTAALAAFALTVTSGAADSVTLSWTAPTVNANGEPVTDLAGYHVYYGTSEANMTTVIAVDKATNTDQVIGNLQPGTWYFAVSAYNSAKIESKISAILQVTL
jgi:Putative Ig domain